MEENELKNQEHHHHHHEHGEDCGCGCHDHEHEHEEHEHHHHHHELVEISHHEGAVIGAMKGSVPVADYAQAEQMLAEQMREAGRRVTEAGGIIGHIKFVLTAPGQCGQISVTDVNENIRHFNGTSSAIEGVAIVFAVEDQDLRSILEETIGSILIREAH